MKPKRERELELEENADTPSVRELYTIIQTLASKCNALETKMQAISKWAHITKQKLNIIEWLNTTYPSISLHYTEWVASLQVTSTDLTILFETDYVNGVIALLKKAGGTTLPVRAFTGKENTFYIARASQKWELCDADTFTKLMYHLDRDFMREFIVWQTANKSRMATDDSFSELYSRYLKKVMGGNFTREQLYTRVKKEWYQEIKSDPPNIMEYEMQF